MKKTYINPTMKVVKLKTRQQMLTVSSPNAGLTSGSVDAGSIEGRDYDFEDEEW